MICLRPEAEAFAVAVVSYGMPWVRDGIFFFGVEAEIEIERSVEREGFHYFSSQADRRAWLDSWMMMTMIDDVDCSAAGRRPRVPPHELLSFRCYCCLVS